MNQALFLLFLLLSDMCIVFYRVDKYYIKIESPPLLASILITMIIQTMSKRYVVALN